MCDCRNIDQLIASGNLDEAVKLLSDAIVRSLEGDDVSAEDEATKKFVADLYFKRGKLFWRLGERGRATTDYAHATELDPESPASMALEQARDVESFFNPDLYNP